MKRLIALALILVALVATAIAAAPFIAATDFAKQRIAAQIEAWTGHPVSFAGEPRVKLFPFLSLTIENAHIGGTGPAAGEPFVSMDRLTCKLRLLPFLLGRVDIAEFQLIRPHFRLAIAPDGRASWFIDRTAEPGSQPRDPNRLAETKLGRFLIVDGSVTYEDARNGRREEFSAVKANLTWPTGKEPVSGSGAFSWRDESVEFNVAVSTPLDLLAGGTSPARFAVASRPLRFSFTGMMNAAGNVRMEGPATVTTPSVRRVLQWLGMSTGNGAILGAGLIDGPLTWEGQRASFDDAQLELDGNMAHGSFSLDFAEARPKIDAVLDFRRLDLTAYLESLQAIGAAGTWPSIPALLPLLDIADTDMQLSAEETLIGTAKIGKGKASLSVGSSGVAIHISEGQLYGGLVKADASLAEAGDSVSGKAEIEVEGSESGALLDQLGLSRSIEGRLSAKGQISFSGETFDEVAASAAGNAKFEISDGALAGFELAEFAALSGAPGANDPAAGSDRIPFKAFGGSLVLDDEALTSNDLHIGGDNFEASLDARFGLATSLIRARGTLKIGRQSGGLERRSVPFMVGGSWDWPVLLPDYERLIEHDSEERGTAPAEESADLTKG